VCYAESNDTSSLPEFAMSFLRYSQVGILFVLVAAFVGLGTPMLVAASKDADAKKATEDLKKSKDAKVKIAALVRLGELGQIQYSYAQPAIPDMLKALEDKDAGVRAAAAKAVGQAGSEDPDTVASLVKLLKADKEESVKIAAAEGLGLLGARAKDAVNDLRAAAKDADKKSKLSKVVGASIKSINGTKK